LADGCSTGKDCSHLTIIRLTIAWVMDQELAREHPHMEPYVFNALKDEQLSDSIAEFDESQARTRWTQEVSVAGKRACGKFFSIRSTR
jgi:hypothetical protein